MKFILAYTICSAINGMCNNTIVSTVEFNSWSDCVKAGSLSTVEIVNQYEEKFNEEKLYITYFCNEIKKENV
jgi:hypothetical protein